ncbi:MAG: hypothetical protein SFZ24_13075 [Planctomycetota bacterium]|nr:hypothetical protein [Planctomycetota bacterium]
MILPPARLVRWFFWPYACLIFALTHWPKLEIKADIPRPDLIIHVVVFGSWTAVFIMCGFFGPRLEKRPVLISGAVSLAYSAVDEALQLIPFINRHAGLDDAAANALGVALATAGMLLLGHVLRGRAGARAGSLEGPMKQA